MKAKYTEGHDRLALVIKTGDITVRISRSRSGLRVSSTGLDPASSEAILNDTLRAANAVLGMKGTTYGQQMRTLERLATEAPTLTDFRAAMWQESRSTKHYAADGTRLTDCCGCHSTYHDSTLICKGCGNEVPAGQGDGSEKKGGRQ